MNKGSPQTKDVFSTKSAAKNSLFEEIAADWSKFAMCANVTSAQISNIRYNVNHPRPEDKIAAVFELLEARPEGFTLDQVYQALEGFQHRLAAENLRRALK